MRNELLPWEGDRIVDSPCFHFRGFKSVSKFTNRDEQIDKKEPREFLSILGNNALSDRCQQLPERWIFRILRESLATSLLQGFNYIVLPCRD
ncbi:MAG: hypothetical protein J7647_11820 [Cyanobacteria bacterium SBLK]|nr:hypothetical protein [Cyanobacteria bacterium SBLK]